MPTGEETATSRMPLTPTNHKRMRQFRNGLTATGETVSFDEAIELLLDQVIQPDEDEFAAGKRLVNRLLELRNPK